MAKKYRPICYLDTETTGLKSHLHEIIEICIIKSVIGAPDELYHVKVRPEHIATADPKALEVNGYSSQDWEDAISQDQLAEDSAKILKGCTIIAHNPYFDMGFLRELWDSRGISCWVDRRYIDTIILAHEHLVPCGLRSCSLDSIRSFLGWSHEGAHSALWDARDVQRLYALLVRSSCVDRAYWTIRHKLLSWLGVKP